MWREIKFLMPCMLGLAAGWFGGRMIGACPAPPQIVQAIAAACAGYLVGGGMIWGIRILGSLAFGKEAMGMGDVHLLGAVAAMVIYVAVLPYVGYLLSTGVVLLALSLVYGNRRWPGMLATAVLVPPAIFYFFERVMIILLPRSSLF